MALSDIDSLPSDVRVGDYGHHVFHTRIHGGIKSLKTFAQNTADTTFNTTSIGQTISGIKTFSSSPITPLVSTHVDGFASKAYSFSAMQVMREDIYATSNSGYYRRGDKIWRTLVASEAGLGNVDNTTDVSKPISIAQQAALDLKQGSIAATSSTDYYRGDKTMVALTKASAGLNNVDNTTDLGKPLSTSQQTALGLKQPSIQAGEVFQYYRGGKTWANLDKSAIGIPNVDNTSDLNKPISTAQQNALDLKSTVAGTVFLSLAHTISGDKTFTTAPKLKTTSTVGHVWTATTTDGLGAWQALPALVTTVDWNNTTVGRPTTFAPTIGSTSTTASAGDHTHTKAQIGLGNADDTTDLNKPISTATQSALNGLVPITRQIITTSHFAPVGVIDSNKSLQLQPSSLGITEMKPEVIRDSICYIQTFASRSVGLGMLQDGWSSPYKMRIVSVRYRAGSLDQSGSTTVELRKNGVSISGTSGTATLTGTALTGTWDFNAGDILTVYTTAVGTLPGRRLTADIILERVI